MTLRLDLLRHGETELGGGLRGSIDDALTDTGWAQMRAAVVGQGPWDRLVSSPLQRCARFAEELGAVRLNPECRQWLLFGHRGAEPGHRHVLETLKAQPLLELGLRLGEGSGAALALSLIHI